MLVDESADKNERVILELKRFNGKLKE